MRWVKRFQIGKRVKCCLKNQAGKQAKDTDGHLNEQEEQRFYDKAPG